MKNPIIRSQREQRIMFFDEELVLMYQIKKIDGEKYMQNKIVYNKIKIKLNNNRIEDFVTKKYATNYGPREMIY